jgi:hypothetical protein
MPVLEPGGSGGSTAGSPSFGTSPFCKEYANGLLNKVKKFTVTTDKGQGQQAPHPTWKELRQLLRATHLADTRGITTIIDKANSLAEPFEAHF